MTDISQLAAVSLPVTGTNMRMGGWLRFAMKTAMVPTSILFA